jgi:F0F1-type ATP synthase assembly protein I
MTAKRPQRGDGGENVGLTIFSYLLSGMLVYGGLGWLIAHWTGLSLIFPLGMLFGLALTIWLVIYRYGRS